jgi:hypothetical protein
MWVILHSVTSGRREGDKWRYGFDDIMHKIIKEN